ncbi:MAG: lamin tail domain-containing protein, partial [Poseidonia sp.]
MKNTLTASSLILLFLLSLTSPMATTLAEVSSPTRAGRSTACSGYVCINEVIPNPAGYDNATYPGGEWFELYNSATVAVDLTGWKVTTSASKTLDFNANTIVGYQAGNSSTWTISPGDYMVIARNGDSNFYMTNGGMSMTLVDDNNNNLHQATWGSVMSGKSYEQDPSSATANWIATTNPTPGDVNTATGSNTLIPGDLIMTEVMANPWPSFDNATWPGGEWVEILNTGTADIDLTGYSIEDAAGNALPFNNSHLVNASQSMLISPGEHRIVAVNGTSTYGVLNNGVESLTLKWPNGSRSQEISYSSTIQGFSLMESTTANAPWTYAPYPTPEGM